MWVIFFPYPEDQLNPYVESSCSLHPTLGVLSAASRSKFFSQPKIRTVPCERKRREGHAVLVWVIFFPYPEDQLNPYVESSCSLQPTLGVLSAASRSFRPSPLIKRLQSWQATIMDRIIDAAANSPSPRKWSMKPRTRRPKTRHFQYLIGGVVNRVPRVLSYWQSLFLRDPSRGPAKEQLSLCRLRRSLATCAELLKIIPDWDPLFRQFPPSGALLHFGRHRYQRQSRHYVKARSLKQSSFSFISLRHVENYKEGNFYLVLLTQLHSLGSFPTKEL